MPVMLHRPVYSPMSPCLVAIEYMMREHFFSLVETLSGSLRQGENLHACLDGEISDFIRFNHGCVRQAGRVSQYSLQLALQCGNKHCTADCDLSGTDNDYHSAQHLLSGLRERLQNCPEDPYINYSDTPVSTDSSWTRQLPSVEEITDNICTAATDMDLVGIYAGGDIIRGYANSYGQRNWHSRTIFNFDWSCHLPGNQAVKSNIAGSEWLPDILEREIDSQRCALETLQRPSKPVRPGQYRAYLAPTALAELLGLISHGGFSLREHRTRQSPLLKLAAGERQLSPLVTIAENRADSLAPLLLEEGFVIPAQVELTDNGRMAEQLVDARSAREFDARINSDSESPVALEMAAGDLADEDILDALDTGLYINNLWYGNFSDPNNCRITGMTRYACYWVENGEIRAPLEVMRFDDSLYRMLGEQLEAITSERRFMHDADTYEQRSLDSMHLPGVLCRALRLTL